MRLKNKLKNISFIFVMLMISLTLFSVDNNIAKAEEKNVKNNVWNFDYTGDYQIFVAPMTAKYKIELWGAQGYGSNSKGAYTSGFINLKKGQIVYVYVGQGGFSTRNGVSFNGSTGNSNGYPGGGATDIRLVPGNWWEFDSTKTRIMVAAGSGTSEPGYDCETDGGYGGALEGGKGNSCVYNGETIEGSNGGTQTSPGERQDPSYYDSVFGETAGGNAGGNGYYGGGASHISAGGGSSFISGYEGCDAIDEATTDRENIIHTGQSIHYSGLYFENPIMIAGNETQPTHPQSQVETSGNDGENGYAVIKAILSDDNYLETLTSDYGTFDKEFDPTIEEYNLTLDKYDTQFTLSGILSDDKSSVTGLGKYEINLGETKTINVLVTSESGNIRTYIINAKRPKLNLGEHSSKLSRLEVENYENDFDKDFHPLINDYKINIITNEIDLNIITETLDEQATVKIEGNRYIKNNTGIITITVSAPEVENTVYSISYNKLQLDPQYSFDYTGNEQEFIVPISGKYKLETWGAAGGNGGQMGGSGSYAAGEIYLKKDTKMYIYVGQSGTELNTPTYNGGGAAGYQYGARSGGGSTDIRLINGPWDNLKSLTSRIIVAAGGSGADGYNTGSYGAPGGTLYGNNGNYSRRSGSGTKPYTVATGASQTTGGLGGIGAADGEDGSFGKGGSSGDITAGHGSGAGSGYYGGGSGSYNGGVVGSGSSGSSYISGYKGAVAITSESDLTPREDSNGNVCVDGTEDITCSYHYSGMIFDNAIMKAGDEIQPTYDGTGTMTGNVENGYAKITPIIPKSDNNYLETLTSDYGTFDKEFDPTIEEYNLTLDKYDTHFTLSGTLSDEKASVSGLEKYKLKFGKTKEVKIIVTSESGNIRTYTVNVTRESLKDGEHSSKLSLLEIENYEEDLIEEFHPLINDYKIKIMSNEMYLNVKTDTFDNEANVKIEGNEYLRDETGIVTITVSEPHVEDTVYRIEYTKVEVESKYQYDCTGGYQEFIVPISGQYKVELWGAQGGSGVLDSKYKRGGFGGYTSGYIHLSTGQKLYIYVGCKGGDAKATGKYNGGVGGYNGGAKGGDDENHDSDPDPAGGGGGATDIRLEISQDGDWSNFNSLKSRIMVAAGGGGGSPQKYGYSGGWPLNDESKETIYKFGYGQVGLTSGYGRGGGAGGYFGGRSDYDYIGHGGISYISGHGVNDAIDKNSTEDNVILTNTNTHYSGLKFINTKMIDGDGYEYTSDSLHGEYVGIPDERGKDVTGYIVNGFAQITTSTLSKDNYLSTLIVENELKEQKLLIPEFDPAIKEYDLELDTAETEIKISGRPSSDLATIQGLGTYKVPAGPQEFDITVTAESGDIRIYKIKTNRKASEESNPKNIEITGLVPSICEGKSGYCILDSEFDPNTNTYKMTVPAGIRDLEFTVDKNHYYQEVTGDGVHKLGRDLNTITIEVTSEDGQNTSTYTYEITRDMTGDNYIDTLEIVNPKVDINFHYLITEYSFKVDNDVTSLDMNIKLDDENASYRVIGNEDFKVGNNIVEIEVTAENGEVRNYILNVYRLSNGNPLLQSLTVDNNGILYTLSPEFKDIKTSYTLTVENDVTRVYIEGIAKVETTSVEGNSYYDLKTGLNEVNIITTAEDGTIETYTIIITRKKSNNNYLSNLNISNGDITPTFDKNENMYSITVNPYTKKLNLNVTLEDPKAKYTVIGNKEFKIGNNLVTIKVEAENGEIRNYYIDVTKEGSDNNYLSSLSVSEGILSPDFDKETLEYNVTVANDITSITINATKEDILSKVSGTGEYNLISGENKITVRVTSETGKTRNYIVNVYRQLNSDSSLRNITVSNGVLSPEFNSETKEYTVNVSNDIEEIIVEGLPTIGTTKVEGNSSYPLLVGENEIIIKGIAEDKTETAYIVKVVRDESSNANLSFLLVKEGIINPKFDKMTLNYTVYIPNEITKVNVLANAEMKTSNITINGTDNLQIGENIVNVLVTSENGSIKTYEIKVIRQEATNNNLNLKTLDLTSCILNPDFNGNNQYYECSVPYEITSTKVTASLEDESNTLEGIGDHDLSVGKNIIEVRVTGNDKKIKDYQVLVTREESTEARLSNILIENHGLNEIFSPDVKEYSITTENSSLNITPIKMHEGQIVEITGNKNFNIGLNEVQIKVTSPDKNHTNTYTLTVLKERSSNNYLSNLYVEGYNISPSFNKGTLVYNLTVENEVNSIIVRGDTDDKNASITGLGMHTLEKGLNEIKVTVTSESGVSKEYTINVTKLGSRNNYLKGLSVKDYEISPSFNKDITTYTLEVDYEVNEIEILAETIDSNATIIGDGIRTLRKGLNELNIVITSENGDVKSYTINVTRKNPVTSLLENIKVKNYELDRIFKSEETDYNVTIDNEVNSLDLEITKLDPNSTYIIEGNSNFKVGLNEVKIISTSSNGEDTTTYTLLVNRQSYSNTYLSTLSVLGYEISPSFNKTNLSYEVKVPYNVGSVEVLATPENVDSKISGTGEIALSSGETIARVQVTSKAGITRTYVIKIVKEASDNANIRNISSNIGTLTKLNQNDYELVVPKNITEITKDNFTVITEDEKASVIKQEVLNLSDEIKLYKITVISPDGSKTNEYIIHVRYELSNDSRIKELTSSDGELKPSFDMNRYDYTLDVLDTLDEVMFDAILNDDTASIVNNNLLYALNDYSTIATITTQAEDGSTSIYTIIIEKSITTEKNLQNIAITEVSDKCENCILPVFEETKYDYSMTVPYSISSFGFDIEKKHKNQEVKIYKDNIEVREYTLDVGINNYKVEVKNSLGEITNYNYVIERLKNTNNYLSSLKLLSPEYEFIDFDKERLEYNVQIPYEYDQVLVEAIAEDTENATVKIEGYTYLLEGNNDVKITVTAQNKEKMHYIIHVLRTPESNNLIKTLTVSSGDIYELTPKFTPGITDYTLKVPNVINRITIEAIPDLESTIISGDVGEFDLKVGSNRYVVESTSIEGQTRTYVITITRLSSMNTYLEKLIVKNGTMNEEFRKDRLNYTVSIGQEVNELDLEYEPEDKESIVEVIGNNNLYAGENIVKIKVKSRDLSTAKTYVLNVTKEKSSNNNLSSLLLDEKEIEGFDKNNPEYNIEVENDKEIINVDARAEDPNAIIKGIGVHSLVEGENKITITVIAANGEEKDYIINIVRKKNTYLSAIITDRGEVTPIFNKKLQEYTIEVEENIKDITVIGLAEDIRNAVVEGNGKYELNTNTLKIVLKVTNGEYVKEYTINIVKNGIDNTYLKYLTVGESLLDKVFDKNIYEYTVTIPHDKTSLSLDYEPELESSTAVEIGNENLNNGDKVIIRVTSALGSTKDYTININKEDESLYSNKLIGLEVEPGELNPAFDMNNNLYKVTVEHEIEEITVRATRESVDSNILGIGNHKLVTGRNEIPVQVISKDGKARVYTIIVTREGTSDARLKTLEFENGRLSPSFNKTIEDYTLIVSSDIDLLKIKNIETIDPNASYNINGDMTKIQEGNKISILVTSKDKKQTKEYNITLKLEKSGNIYLKELSPSVGKLTPTFEKTENKYEMNVTKDINSIYINALPESKNATVDGNKLYTLNQDVTYINITVTAENGNTNVYVIKVTRGKSSNNNLKSLSVRGYTIYPEFSNDNEKQEYSVTVPNEVTSVKIDAIKEDPNAKVIGNNIIELGQGLNEQNVIVTAEDGSMKTYIVKITREEMYSSKIQSLDIREGVLLPNFNSYTYEYDIYIPNEFTSITPVIKLMEDTATYEVVGNENLKQGNNEVKIIVKSSNKDIEDSTYTINVVKLPASNNYLSNIEVNTGKLTPEFTKEELNYTVTVGNDIEEIRVTATAELNTTRIEGEGTYSLQPGENTIIITGISESGIPRNYKIKVIREYNSNNYLSSLVINRGTLTPEFDKTNNIYSVTVPEGTNTIEISGSVEDERAEASGFGSYDIEVGSKVITIFVTAENGDIRPYEIEVTRNISSNTNITSFVPNTGELSPTFDNETNDYELRVDKNTDIVDFDIILESSTATVIGNKNILVDELEKEIKIIVTAEDGSQRVITVNIIKESSVEDILLKEDTVTLGVDEEYQIDASVIPENALNNGFIYVSSDENIIKVDENGKVTAKDIGSTSITITSKDNPNVQKTLIINVVLKIIKSNVYDVLEKDEGKIIIGMDPGITLRELKESLLNDEDTIKIYDINNNEITDYEDIVKTGQKIKLVIDNVEYDNAIIIVRGDTNGDGKINITDMTIVQNHILLKEMIDNYVKYAADPNTDDRINITDSTMINDYILLKRPTLN